MSIPARNVNRAITRSHLPHLGGMFPGGGRKSLVDSAMVVIVSVLVIVLFVVVPGMGRDGGVQ